MEEFLEYFETALSDPNKAEPWPEWWARNSDAVQLSFTQEEYLKLKFHRLDAARKILLDRTGSFVIAGLGAFTPERQSWNDLICCYSKTVLFRDQNVELIIYENAPDLEKRLLQFQRQVGEQLKQFPAALRQICDKYGIDISHLSDVDLVNNLEWLNIKLDPSGTVECYTNNTIVTTNFQIVIGFDQQMALQYVHFDG